MLRSVRILLICLIASGPLLGEVAADEISELSARIAALEAAQAVAPCSSAPCTCEPGHNWIQAGCQPGSLFFPSTCTTVKFGGYAKLDAIYDFQDAGNRFLFDPNTIPVDGGRGEQATFDARQSRLYLDANTPTDWGDLQIYFEADFFSDFTSDGSFRLRHAYGELGSVLAGKTWVVATDVDAIPETLDFNGPEGNTSAREAQIRWTGRPTDDITWTISLQEPRHMTLTTVPGEQRDRIPVFTSSLRFRHDTGHVYMYGGIGETRFVPDVGASNEAFVWGAGVSLRQQFGDDYFILQGGITDGFVDFLPNFLTTGQDIIPGGAVDPLVLYGFVAAYQHVWNDSLRSNVTYRTAIADNSPLQPGDAVHRNQYLAANLIWTIIDDRVDVGIEYLHGVRENKDGASGDANRLIFSAIYRLP